MVSNRSTFPELAIATATQWLMGKLLRFKDLAQELGLFLFFKSSQVNPITHYFSTEQELFFFLFPRFGTFLNHQANIKNVDLGQRFQQKDLKYS